MWLPSVICLLLAFMATTTQAAKQERPKRDLQFLKDVLAAKLGLTPPKPVQKEEEVKILRVPGFDQFLVRAVPRVTFVEAPMPERIVQVDPTMALIGSYLGTKSAEETIFALQNMKQLLQSGVMSAREVIEVAPPRPIYVPQPPIVQQNFNWPAPRPVYPIFERTVVPMPQPLPVLPPISVLPPLPLPATMPVPIFPPLPVLPPPAKLIPVPPKVVVPEIRPVVPIPLPPPVVPIIPTRYSYRQGYADGSVTTYVSEGNQDVIVTETHGPPPPLPVFIIERLENIISGRPTGSLVPVSEVVVGRIYSEPMLPIVTGPSNVEVKFNSHKPQKVPEADGISYKHVHSDGTISTYTGTTNKPLEKVHFENISKLPLPPPEILQRMQAASGEAYKPKAWGYTLKTSNGVSSYETLDGGKIFYSRLESPPANVDVSVIAAALSSPTNDQPKSTSNNVIFIENEKESVDEFGRPFISTAANGEKETTTRPDIEPMKKYPALPMPIAGESHYAGRYSYKIVNNPNSPDGRKFTFSTETPSTPELTKNNEYHGFGTNGFSYTQVNHDGTVNTFTGTEMESKPAIAIEAIKEIPVLPAPIVDEQPKAKNPAAIINVNEEQKSGFSYTQINKEGSVTTISGDGNVKVPPVLVVEEDAVQPVVIVDVIQPVSKPPCKSNKKCKKPHSLPSESSGFSYTQISNEGSVIKFKGDGQVQIPVVEVVEVPAPPVAIVDVIQSPVLVEVGKKHAVEVFPKPVWSNYVYKQISHTNPQPFTVVKVGDGPDIEVPAGEVQVKVNKHEHVRPDGTTYPCMEVHKVVPDAPIPPIPTSQMVSTVPESFLYVPPENENRENSLPNSHKIELRSGGSHFSYTQVSGVSSSETPTKSSESSSDEPTTFQDNPIVVVPEDSIYSYTQKHSDGSSLNVQGDKNNTVSVTTIEGELKTSDSGRGDIPEATA